jgi:hypothetical protein
VLIVLGVATLAYQGITYTTRETVIDVGPLHATADRQRTLPLPPVLGAVAVVEGIVLLLPACASTHQVRAVARALFVRRAERQAELELISAGRPTRAGAVQSGTVSVTGHRYAGDAH